MKEKKEFEKNNEFEFQEEEFNIPEFDTIKDDGFNPDETLETKLNEIKDDFTNLPIDLIEDFQSQLNGLIAMLEDKENEPFPLPSLNLTMSSKKFLASKIGNANPNLILVCCETGIFATQIGTYWMLSRKNKIKKKKNINVLDENTLETVEKKNIKKENKEQN